MEGLATWVSRLLGLALIGAVILNFTNVIARYVFDHALTGADEFEIFLMVGMAFLGSLVAQIRRRHLRMDVLTRYLPPRAARAVRGVELALTIAVCGLMTYVSWTYTVRIFRIGIHSSNADIPMWIPHATLVVAFGLITLVEIARLFIAGPPPAPAEPHPS